jgi:hypothetical protein
MLYSVWLRVVHKGAGHQHNYRGISTAIVSAKGMLLVVIKGVNSRVVKVTAKPRLKPDANARAAVVFDDTQVFSEQEEAPSPLTDTDIEKRLISSSYKQYNFTMRI